MLDHLRATCVVLALVVGGLAFNAPQSHLFAAPAQRTNTQTDEKRQTTQGNPSTKVWVNTLSHVYHCPGTRYYGNTKNGMYMTQADAQKNGNRPAYGKYCQ